MHVAQELEDMQRGLQMEGKTGGDMAEEGKGGKHDDEEEEESGEIQHTITNWV